MTTSQRVCIAAAIFFLSGMAMAQESAPTLDPNLPTYKSMRESLLADGWKPDAGFGLKLANGKPAYRFPEVVCGPQICAGKWRKGKDEQKVTILRGDGKEEYRVAPQ